jgi:aminoglycoside 6'-N-acetyltransferase
MTTLRPLRAADLDALSAWRTDPEAGGEFQWMGFQSARGLHDRFANDEVITADGGTLAVVDGETLCGDVSWRRVQTGASSDNWCWNIGILLLPAERGKGHGHRAQRLLAAYLFDHTPCQRVEASTDIDNIGEQKSLEKAGFGREGVMRRFQWRQGAWRDFVLYSKLRGEE